MPKETLENPKISVIIPAYNAKRFIGEAIESVLRQTVPAHEIIVVDDGSTDGTGDFVQEHYGDAVKLIWQTNKGMGAARNAGIQVATGNIFQFLDADDLLLPHKFEVQIDFWRRNPNFDIVYCDHLYFRDGAMPSTIASARPLPQGNLLKVLVRYNPLGVHTALVLRQVTESVGGFCEDKGIQQIADLDFWLRCAIQGFSFGYVPEVLALTRRYGGNSTANQIHRMEVRVRYRQRLLTMGLPLHLIKFVHRNLADEYTELSLAQLAERQWTESWRSLWKAWHHHCAAAKLAGNRDKALWVVDVLRWMDRLIKVLSGKAIYSDDPVLR